VPGRPKDDFGLGWARTEFSDDFVPFMRDRFDLGLDHEDAIEVFYNVSVTPWLSVSPNFQFIAPALDRTVDSNGNFEDLDDIYLAGVRIGVRF
jgi:porin